jgi:hypothetical protein
MCGLLLLTLLTLQRLHQAATNMDGNTTLSTQEQSRVH